MKNLVSLLAKSALLPTLLLCLALSAAVCARVEAQGGVQEPTTGPSTGNSEVTMIQQWRYMTPTNVVDLDKSLPGGMINYGPHGETKDKVEGPPLPGKIWPITLPPSRVEGPEKMMAWAKEMDKVTGYSQPQIGTANLTPAMAALSMATAGQMLADQLQSPQAAIPKAREEQNQQTQQGADNCAAMERSQAGCAIDFVASYLHNFTVDGGNKWNTVRNQLFVPMALLLLLPGAVLAQVKSIVSQGLPVLGEISPFDGLFRAIVAIFLIPGTYLVVNYGIDLSNSIAYTIAAEYQRIFGSDMYQDAMCAHIRAFPFREPAENKNFVPNQEAKMGPLSPNSTPFAKFEGQMLDVKLMDPCAGINIVPKDRANEQVKYAVNAQRNGYNTANAALAMTWNILCAFQMAYLYYLWFVGPVVAALWVYPMKQLRDAFPSWCEGVVTLCFWSLFWNTTILIMACFRGVDDTGTVIMTALNFLSTACVKFAFDFAGLVKDAGKQAAAMAQKAAEGAGKGGAASGKGAANPTAGHNGAQGQGGNVHSQPGGNNTLAGRAGGHASAGNGDLLAGNTQGGLPLETSDAGLNSGDSLNGFSSALSSPLKGQVDIPGLSNPPLSSGQAFAAHGGGLHHGGGHGGAIAGGILGGLGLLALAAAEASSAQAVAAAQLAAQPSGAPAAGGLSGSCAGADGQILPFAPQDFNLSLLGDNFDIDHDTTFEGDDVDHNYGTLAAGAANSPSTQGSASPDGSLPPPSSAPAVTLTPSEALSNFFGSPDAPPASAGGAQLASGTTLPVDGNQTVPNSVSPASHQGDAGSLFRNLHDGQAIAGLSLKEGGLHREHLLPGHADATHSHPGRTHAGADRHNINSQMYKDALVAGNAAGNAISPPPAKDELSTRQANNMQMAAANPADLLKDASLLQPSVYQTAAANLPGQTYNQTDYALSGASGQKSYIDPAAAAAAINASGNNNFNDTAAASFAALASSVVGSDLPASCDPGISSDTAISSLAASSDYNAQGSDLFQADIAYENSYYNNAATYDGDSYSCPLALSSVTDMNSVLNTGCPTGLADGSLSSQTPSASLPPVSPTSEGQARVLAYSDNAYLQPSATQPAVDIASAQASALQAAGYQPPAPEMPLQAASLQKLPADSIVTPPGSPALQAQAAAPLSVLSAGLEAMACGAVTRQAVTPSTSDAQQQLRNQIAQSVTASQGKTPQPLNQQQQPAQARQGQTRPSYRQPPVFDRAGSNGARQQSRMASALGRAATRPSTGPAAPQKAQSGAPQAKPALSRVSNPLKIDDGNTLRRYRAPRKLTSEELALAQEAARQSGGWLTS